MKLTRNDHNDKFTINVKTVVSVVRENKNTYRSDTIMSTTIDHSAIITSASIVPLVTDATIKSCRDQVMEEIDRHFQEEEEKPTPPTTEFIDESEPPPALAPKSPALIPVD